MQETKDFSTRPTSHQYEFLIDWSLCHLHRWRTSDHDPCSVWTQLSSASLLSLGVLFLDCRGSSLALPQARQDIWSTQH